jgi:hypothetical protein
VAKDDKHENGSPKTSQHEANPSQSGHPSGQRQSTTEDASDQATSLLTSAALIGVGALLEPELLGGMLLGAGAVYVARTLPIVGGVLRPMMKSAIKFGYAAASRMNEVVSEASEDVQDLIAEARSEYQDQ